MQILSTQEAVLTNNEVLQHLNEIWGERLTRAKGAKESGVRDDPPENLRTMRTEMKQYFSNAVSANALPNYKTWPEEITRTLLEKLKKFKLTKTELIMIMNLKPTDSVFLDCIVEELDYRIPKSEDQEELLVIINETLGGSFEAAIEGDEMQVDGTQATDDADEHAS